MLHRIFFTAALGAALFVPTTSFAESPPSPERATPVIRASASKLQSDARRLDATAARLERASAAKRDRAVETRARAGALEAQARRARGAARARLEARADDARTSAAIADATAKAKAAEAAAVRTEAKTLRAQARRRAKAGPNTSRGNTSSLALSSREPCRVRIDGASYGYTPHARVRLAPGTHDVVCETLGGATLRHRVVTRAGTIRRMHFDTSATRTAAVIDPFH